MLMLLLWATFAFHILSASAGAAPFIFDDQKGCGEAKSPEQLAESYCRLFELSPLLKSDETSRKARQQCVRFYKNAAETANVVCTYRLQASLQAARHQRATEEAASSQRGLVDHLAGLNQEAKDFHNDLLDRLQEKFDRTEETNKAYGETLANLAGIAGRTSVNEAVCLKPPSEVPGALLTGLLLTALEDKKKTFDLLMEMINGLGDHADKVSKAENAAAFQLSQAGGNLGKVVPAPPSSVAPVGRGEPGREVEKPDGLFTQLLIPA